MVSEPCTRPLNPIDGRAALLRRRIDRSPAARQRSPTVWLTGRLSKPFQVRFVVRVPAFQVLRREIQQQRLVRDVLNVIVRESDVEFSTMAVRAGIAIAARRVIGALCSSVPHYTAFQPKCSLNIGPCDPVTDGVRRDKSLSRTEQTFGKDCS